MVEIFINYRTADEPYGAVLIDKHLSDRFGMDRVFRASKSIPSGTAYPEALLRAVRESKVLLAIIGTTWLTATGKNGVRCLDDPDDWVRKELAEAFAHEVKVVPVLLNTARLVDADLPADIEPLKWIQGPRIDSRNHQQALRSLSRDMEKLIPGLKAKVRNSGRARSVVGDVSGGTVFLERVDIKGGFTVNNGRARDSGGEG